MSHLDPTRNRPDASYGSPSRSVRGYPLVWLSLAVGAVALVIVILLTVVLVVVIKPGSQEVAAVGVTEVTSPPATSEASEPPEDIELAPEALLDAVASMPDMPALSWRATPESLGLGPGLSFDVGGRNQRSGTMIVGDLVVTRYSPLANFTPDVIADFMNPDPNKLIRGLVALDSATGAVRWKLDLNGLGPGASGQCYHVEGTDSAVCSAGVDPEGWSAPEEYQAYAIIDLREGDVIGLTALPPVMEIIREVNGRVVSIGRLLDDLGTEISSGTLEDPRADWSARVQERPRERSGLGSLDRIGSAEVSPTTSALPDGVRTDCLPPSPGHTNLIGDLATLWKGTSRVIDLRSGEPVEFPSAIDVRVTPGGGVFAVGVCPPGTGEAKSTFDLETSYVRRDGVPLPDITGAPLLGSEMSANPVVATVSAAELPVFTSSGAFSVNGEKLWSWPDSSPSQSGIAVVGDTVIAMGFYAPLEKGSTRAFNLATGEEKWHADIPMESTGGFPYFVSTDGDRLFTSNGAAISVHTGETEWDLPEFPEPPPFPGVAAKLGNTTPFTQWMGGTVVHSNERELIGYR